MKPCTCPERILDILVGAKFTEQNPFGDYRHLVSSRTSQALPHLEAYFPHIDCVYCTHLPQGALSRALLMAIWTLLTNISRRFKDGPVICVQPTWKLYFRTNWRYLAGTGLPDGSGFADLSGVCAARNLPGRDPRPVAI